MVGDHYTSPGTFFGSGLSFYDFNGDGWDDLTIGLGENTPLFFLNDAGTFTPADFSISTEVGNHIVMMLWADYDNDDDEDLLVTRTEGTVQLWQNDGEFNFVNVANQAGLVTGTHVHGGAAFADYNHDGCLDLYIARYYDQMYWEGWAYHNRLYKNNCDGTFTDVTIAAGVDVLPSLTFQPIFYDYNKDGWEDLYLINELAVYPNNLFENNGDGTFSEVSESTGAGIYIDAMTGTVGDFNNDLLLDVFVTNRTSTGGNHMLVDQGDGTYENEAEALGFGTNYQSWGAVWLDYDNDRWQDIFVSIPEVGNSGEEGNAFYVNSGGTGFINARDEVGFGDDYSHTFVCARGDMNNDGYYELAHSSRIETPFQLYANSGGDNHFISVTLEGTLSNRNGIGSWIYCYAGDHHAVHYTMCGENLIGQNSGKYSFGLGDITAIDSLVVEWNRGTREVYTNLSVDQHLHLLEGASLTQPFEISVIGNLLLCLGDSTILEAGDFEQYLWNTGDTTQSIAVSQAGTYTVETWNEFGLSATSVPIEISVAPIAEVSFEKTNISCAGADDGAVEVTFSNGAVSEILWNTGDTLTFLENMGPGAYSFSSIDAFGCPVEGSVSIEEPPPLLAQVLTTNALCFGDSSGSASANILGGTPPYDTDWMGIDSSAFHAGEYFISITDTNGCTLDVGFVIDQPDSLWATIDINHASNGIPNGSAEIEVFGGTPPYTVLWSNGVMDIMAINDLGPGMYSAVVTDGHGCTWELSFVVETNTGFYRFPKAPNPTVFPNPSGGWVKIAQCGSTVIEYKLFDAAGRIVQSQSGAPCPGHLNFGHLFSGSYILEIKADSNIFRQRIMLIIP